jgi:hypothetical protein
MSFSLILTSHLSEDVEEALLYYESIRPGLGLRFLSAIEVCLDEINRHPLIYQIKYSQYRYAKVKKFPYVLFFEVVDKEIIVYQLFHCKRNPDKRKLKPF